MRLTRTKVAVTGVVLALTTAACGGSAGEEGGSSSDVDAAENAAENFDDGTKMKELAEAGEITVGVRYDQPGLGFKDAASDIPAGFDVEIAKLIIAELGIDPESDKVTWEETISDNREPFLTNDRVDLVLASYSITDERRQLVGQTGPYLLTGQKVMVAADSDVTGIADLKGKRVCAAQGSTSLENIEAEGATPVPAESYSQCTDDLLNGSIDAVSTDESILLGLAAQNEGELTVVGEEFSEERIGVGYPKDAPEMCEFINETIQKAYDDDTWAEAFEATLGGEDVETPEPPALDECQS